MRSSSFGKLDTKIIDIELFEKKSNLAISGPTHANSIVPFCWNNKDSFGQKIEPKFKGMPECFDFDWVEISPETINFHDLKFLLFIKK